MAHRRDAQSPATMDTRNRLTEVASWKFQAGVDLGVAVTPDALADFCRCRSAHTDALADKKGQQVGVERVEK
eukprot:6195762-Pleurochrysis_carterae.AAC.1